MVGKVYGNELPGMANIGSTGLSSSKASPGEHVEERLCVCACA